MKEIIINAAVNRYHEKLASNFLGDWIKDNIPLPSKEKAKSFLKKHLKSEKDLDKIYSQIKSISNFLKIRKSKEITADDIFPSGFVKNLAILVAIVSILGHLETKEITLEKLEKENIVTVEKEEKVQPVKKYLGQIVLNKSVLKKIKNKSVEEMNKIILKSIKDNIIEQKSDFEFSEVKKVKYPLELKITLDSEGRDLLFPSDADKLKDNKTVFVHRDRSSEDVERIEKNIKEMEKEKKKRTEQTLKKSKEERNQKNERV